MTDRLTTLSDGEMADTLLTLVNKLQWPGEESDKVKKGGALPGEIAFKLYDTYGCNLNKYVFHWTYIYVLKICK